MPSQVSRLEPCLDRCVTRKTLLRRGFLRLTLSAINMTVKARGFPAPKSRFCGRRSCLFFVIRGGNCQSVDARIGKAF